MAVEKIDVVLGVPKEGKEIVDAVVGIIAAIKAKKGVAEIAGEALPKVVAAVDGFGNLSEELKSDGKDELFAYLVREVAQVLA